MSRIIPRVRTVLNRIDSIFDEFEEGKLTEIGLMDYLDGALATFIRGAVPWSMLKTTDYFKEQFSGNERLLMLYADVMFANTRKEE